MQHDDAHSVLLWLKLDTRDRTRRSAIVKPDVKVRGTVELEASAQRLVLQILSQAGERSAGYGEEHSRC